MANICLRKRRFSAQTVSHRFRKFHTSQRSMFKGHASYTFLHFVEFSNSVCEVFEVHVRDASCLQTRWPNYFSDLGSPRPGAWRIVKTQGQGFGETVGEKMRYEKRLSLYTILIIRTGHTHTQRTTQLTDLLNKRSMFQQIHRI